MDTIKRLGENETVRRISNGTLKSYVDREIDTVDTSAFINLETLNVPKAESVTIGEGVKDTLEVLNAPKAEEVAVDSGKLVVNWGKCGGTSDLIVTYKKGDPLWVPKAFLLTGFDTSTTYWGLKADNFSDHSVGYKGAISNIAIWKLPQELGKWLYENAEDCPQGYYGGNVGSNRHAYKGIAMYPNVIDSSYWDRSDAFGVGIRTKADIDVYEWSTTTPISPLTSSNVTPIKESLEDGAYYLVWQSMPETSGQGEGWANYQLKLCFSNVANDDSGTDHLYFRHYNTMTAIPSATNQGEKYACPFELCMNNTLSNLPSLKVTDVHTMDVDVPMFKGCANLEKATVGGTRGVEPLVVNWGKCGGSSDVIVTYNIGDPLWIPYAYLKQAFNSDSTLKTSTWSTDVGYVGNWSFIVSQSTRYVAGFKLPQELGKYLYENAENCADGNIYGTTTDLLKLYKGIAIYPDSVLSLNNDSMVQWCGIGIRKKSDICQYRPDGTSYTWDVSSLEDDAYYISAEVIENDTLNNLRGQLYKFADLIDDTSSSGDHIYLRHLIKEAISSTNIGKKYTVPIELCAPTLDSSYFEGCDNLKEVTITNPELRVGNAIPKTLTVNWGKCGGTEDVIVEYGEGDSLYVPKAFLWNAPTVGKDEVGLVDNSTKAKNSGQLSIYRLPQKFGKWLYDNAESVTEEHPRAYDGDNDYSKYWKGIATYPDLEYSGISESWWPTNAFSNSWNVGIRTGADLKSPNGCRCINYDGTLTSVQDIISETTKANLNDNDYYLVLESAYIDGAWSSSTGMGKMLYNATGLIYFRHWNTLESSPNGTTVMGEKYTTPSELLPQIDIYADETKVPVEEQPLVVNWGKCGGDDDVIVEYGAGESIWIPTEFLSYGQVPYGDTDGAVNDTSGTKTLTPRKDKLFLSDGVTKDTSIGYKTFFTQSDCSASQTERHTSYSYWIGVYKLPQEFGKWLHENAESNLGLHDDYSENTDGGLFYRNYKGIATYPDNPSSWEGSQGWGVGIRTKEDIIYIGVTNGKPSSLTGNDYKYLKRLPQWEALEDDAYYLVAQNGKTVDNALLGGQINLFGNEKIYLRHYNTMTAPPSSTNMGIKYTIPAELCRPQKNVYYSKTRKEDSFTVNWGKCGGTEDVLATFKVGDPLYIPKDFLTLGKTMSQLVAYTDDNLDTEVGYKTWFCNDDTGSKTERNTTRSYWINVYKLPQELGKWLYENAEDNLGGHLDYSTNTTGGGIMDRNYKGIAFYPDDALYYINSQEWGIGIRKKEDLCVVGYSLSNDVMTPMKATGLGSIECIENFSQYKALEDDAYYLVAQASSDDTTEKYALNPVANFFGNSTIYLRHWNTMTAKPDGGENMGKKYTVTSELLSPLQITMAEYLKENNPNYDFRER